MEAISSIILAWFFSFMVCVCLSYLIGSIPFGMLITRLAGLGDIRQIGSGNIGATNVLRTGRKSLAVLTLLLDLLKGVVAVLLASSFYSIIWKDAALSFEVSTFIKSFMPLIAGVFVVIGHVFSIFVDFKGGKGVATAVGVFLALWPALGIVLMIGWVLIAFFFRYSSLASITIMIGAPIIGYLNWPPTLMHQTLLPFPYLFAMSIISVLVLFRHRDNIKRLIEGQESKINFKKKA